MDLSGFKGKKDLEEKTFEKFLSALFGRQYQLKNIVESTNFTEFARYYQALPAVSPSVHTATLQNTSFWSSMMKDPCSVLVSATALRNEVLFKDSFLICLGPWSNPAYLKLSDKDLLNLAAASHAKMCLTILKAHQDLLSIFAEVQNFKLITKSFQDAAVEAMDLGKLNMPLYFRKCFEALNSFALGDVPARLVQNQSKSLTATRAGEGQFKHYFLCKSSLTLSSRNCFLRCGRESHHLPVSQLL